MFLPGAFIEAFIGLWKKQFLAVALITATNVFAPACLALFDEKINILKPK